GHACPALASDDFTPLARLHVDDGAESADGDALLDPADRHLDVDGRHEVRLELDALPNDRREAAQREGDRVDARPQIDDAILARFVGDRAARLLDQNRTAGFDGDPGQDAAGRVPDDAGDSALAGLGQ